MPRRTKSEDEVEEREDDFTHKASELAFDPWGVEEDDEGSSRRRDPLRRQLGYRPPAEEVDAD